MYRQVLRRCGALVSSSSRRQAAAASNAVVDGANAVRRWLSEVLLSSMSNATSRRRLAVASFALPALCFSASAQTVGQTVAVLELAAPAAQQFTLRGTVPVPKGVFPRADGKTPFRVRNFDGTFALAQTEIVSRYPKTSDGADVVEIIARVKRAPTVAPGTYIRFDVVFNPHVDTAPVFSPFVNSLRASPGLVLLEARDVFGNLYRADLRQGALGVKTLKNGSNLVQHRTYDVLRPVTPKTGAQATLPHLMGVHAYFTWIPGEDSVQLDLRVHNACSGTDDTPGAVLDDVQREMYFDKLELSVPAGWNLLNDFPDPSVSAAQTLTGGRRMIQLVKPVGPGKMNFIGRQAQFERRVALCRVSQEARARELIEERYLGFCRLGTNSSGAQLWSWWNPNTARFFPQRNRLPDLSYMGDASGYNTTRGKLKADFERLIDFFSVGASMNVYPLHFPRLGWAHPWGVGYGGMTGGTEITLYDGVVTAYAASNHGYRYTLLRHRQYTDRMPDALFDMNGDPTTLSKWLVQGANNYVFMPGNFYQTQLSGPDMIGFNQASTHQVDYARNNGFAPAYEAQLAGFKAVDMQHLVRYTNSPKVLVWLGNDSVAKDDLLMQAELARMSYMPHHTGGSGYVLGSTMLADLNAVSANGPKGFSFGRAEGWMIDAMCAAYSVAPPAWRTAALGWFQPIPQMVHNGRVGCTGIIQAIVNNKILSAQFRARQSTEQAIVENALWSLRESVFRDVNLNAMQQLQTVLVDAAYAMIGFPGWNGEAKAPHSYIACGPLNTALPLYCNLLPAGGIGGGVDKHQSWSTLAYGYQLTGDTLFLLRAMQMNGPNFPDFTSAVQGPFGNLENRAALTALQYIQYP